MIVRTVSIYRESTYCATSWSRMPSYWQLFGWGTIERACIMSYWLVCLPCLLHCFTKMCCFYLNVHLGLVLLVAGPTESTGLILGWEDLLQVSGLGHTLILHLILSCHSNHTLDLCLEPNSAKAWFFFLWWLRLGVINKMLPSHHSMTILSFLDGVPYMTSYLDSNTWNLYFHSCSVNLE